jgi:hypothetical protein
MQSATGESVYTGCRDCMPDARMWYDGTRADLALATRRARLNCTFAYTLKQRAESDCARAAKTAACVEMWRSLRKCKEIHDRHVSIAAHLRTSASTEYRTLECTHEAPAPTE